MFAIAAFACFLLAMFEVFEWRILIALGLALLSVHMLVGSVVSLPTIRRRK